MAGVTAMAAGGEQTQSAHACDVSLGARITVSSGASDSIDTGVIQKNVRPSSKFLEMYPDSWIYRGFTSCNFDLCWKQNGGQDNDLRKIRLQVAYLCTDGFSLKFYHAVL